MAVGAPLAQKSGFVFGLLTLAANETKPLSDAAFSAVATAPNACSGIVVKLRTGAARLADKAADATDGWTLATNQAFGDVAGSDLSTIYIQETAGSTATIEVLCRTGRIS